MSLLMEALRRAESQQEDKQVKSTTEAPADNSENTVSPGGSGLSLEPLQPDPVSGDGPAAPVIPTEPGNETSQRDEPDVARQEVQAKPAPAPTRTVGGRSNILYFATGLASVVLVVGGYYFWRSAQTVDTALPHSATLFDHTDRPVTEPPSLPATAQSSEVLPVVHRPPSEIAATPAREASIPPQIPAVGQPPQQVGPAADKPAYRIEIRKGTKTRTVNPMLAQAYQSYTRGDYASAETLYRQVIRRYPDNRDALLGLAGVAMRQGDHKIARHYYERLLKITPGDRTALLALQSLAGNADSVQHGSQIKHWLQADADNAQLHFALANHYARSGQWKEAQEAYFQAQRIEPSHPDYAFNLAVSLDRLGHSRQALDYYRKAHSLGGESAALFSISQVEKRIQQLESAMEAQP